MHRGWAAQMEKMPYYTSMHISRAGMWAIGIAALSFLAVMTSYTPADTKASSARLAASASLAYGGYGSYDDSYDYGYDYSSGYGDAYNYDSYYGYDSSYGYDNGYAPYDGYGGYGGSDYYDYGPYGGDYYGDYGYGGYGSYNTSNTTIINQGWSFGGGYSSSPFPIITSAMSSVMPRVQPVVISNPYYVQPRQPIMLPPIQPNAVPKPSCSLSANPSNVEYGGSTVLSWTSQGADNASLDTVGPVATIGARTINNVVSTRTYGLSVNNRGGQASCYTLISVGAPVSKLSCLISTNPQIIRQGQQASLSWGSSGSVSASLSGGGASGTVPPSGGIAIAPVVSTTYTLSLRDQYGNTRTCSTGILVQ